MEHLHLALATAGIMFFWTFTSLEVIYRIFSKCPKWKMFFGMMIIAILIIVWRIVRFHIPFFADQTYAPVLLCACIIITQGIIMAIKKREMNYEIVWVSRIRGHIE